LFQKKALFSKKNHLTTMDQCVFMYQVRPDSNPYRLIILAMIHGNFSVKNKTGKKTIFGYGG